jgi:hypothetical protein
MARDVFANACLSASSCATTPCDFDAAGSWTSCGGTFPQPTDTWTVQTGHTVFLDTSLTTRAGTVRGNFRTITAGVSQSLIGPAGTIRGVGNNGVSLTLIGTAANELNIGATGVFQMRQGDALVCDSTAAPCEYIITSGGLLDLQGDVHETTVADPLIDAVADAATCGTTSGRKWTFPVASDSSFAAVKGRVRFLSGKARNREFEIVGVTGEAITVCTLLDDAMSVSTYGGQRLTPHAPVGVLGTRHAVPTVDNSASPFYAAPTAGDAVAIIQDVTLKQTGGTRGFRIGQAAQTGLSMAPILRAIHLNGIGISGLNSILFTAASRGLSFGAIEYVNLHDYAGNDQFALLGWQNSTFRYINGHDARPGAGDSSGILVPSPALLANSANGDYPADGVDILDSTFYRTRGNAINLNVSNTTLFSTGNIVRGNLAFDGCTTGVGECSGIEVNACQFCDVSYNVVYDICQVSGSDGDLMRLGGGTPSVSRGSVAHHNWLVNGCGEGLISNYGDADLGREVTFTANYISNVRLYGGHGGRWFGDVIRNWGLDNTNSRDGLHNPQSVAATWLLGNDTGIGGGSGCATGCSRNGILLDTWGADAPGDTVAIEDVWVGGLDSTSSDGVRVDNSTDFNVTVDQLSCDNLGGASHSCIYLKVTNPITVAATDLTAESMGGGYAVVCSGAATDTIGNLLYSRTLNAPNNPNNVRVSTANCNSTGTWTGLDSVGHRDPTGGDDNFLPGAPGLTLGAGGGPIGFSAFRSPRNAINAFWGGALPFDLLQPVDVSTLPNQDTDGDGVIDLYDNCDQTWNPSQYDSSCSAGACVPGEFVGWITPCDDGNPCTVSDVCEPSGRCGGTSLGGGAACDDHNACTHDDRCVTGAGATAVCEGTGTDCSDGDLCTVDRCDSVTGLCQHPPVSCWDGNACTADSCDPATGLCRRDNLNGPCDDGLFCTVGDACAAGTCVGTPRICPDSQCGVGFCDEQEESCRLIDQPDRCPAGECYVSTCQDGFCRFDLTGPFEACDPHLPNGCGVGVCERGSCQLSYTIPCDDGNPCTVDRCDPVTGCVHEGPTQPSAETCNGIDDDCDGLVDEREAVLPCTVSPTPLWDSIAQDFFSVTCRLSPACAPPAPPTPEPFGTVWLSAADLWPSPADNAALPDPFDRCAQSIVENPTRRQITDSSVTFVFDPSGDGVCGTTGGGSAGLVREMADIPDGLLARVCVKWRPAGPADTERCGVISVRHEPAARPLPIADPVRVPVTPAP